MEVAMERGIGNRVDEVAMSLKNSQHRTFGFEEKWMVTCFGNSHNHALLDEKEIRFLPAYRDIPINDQARILLLSKVGCSVSLIMRVLEAEKGIEAGHLPFLDKDIRNFIKSQIGVAVNIRNQAGEEARMRQKYHNPLMKTSFPIEEHAASILTPYAFELLQHEIELSTKYAATMIDNDSYSVRHHTKLDGGCSVTWIKEKSSIRCSCKQFEFSGILCRHVIRVLLKNDYFSIPEEYLPSRWRRESSLIPQSRHIINYNDNSSVEFRSLVQCLEVESLKTKDRVEEATKELKKVIHYLKGMPEVQENSIDLEHGVLNVDECDVENPITSKTKGRPRGSRAKGGVEAAKKSRHCHYPNCGGTDHDSRNYPIKRNKDSLLASQSSPNK
ncbi:Protein FAR1-RELATED SEQUENCE 11 [Vigna angularis]|uniref:Protein FAR1-RELATED SEQUENCE n=1 Tax=Phaseolus angularis TaxID=3914 RepID=A0A8T0KDA5_PHAAN|nr:Protein FAR1-RELATED SEQUENCE 11 [Vigna angularis]